jgi:tetratricopeptide (TPR) repeat protein
MSEDPSNRNPLETDETLSSTGGLPPDFFDVPESPASDRHAQSLPARDALLPPRLAEAPASPRVVIERRASLPVVLVVLAGNIAFFLGGGLAGWAAARKGAARTEPPPPPTTNSPLSEVVRAIEAKASKSALDALSSRIGEVQSEVGTLGRELARLEERLNTTTNAPAAQPAPLDLTPLQTRIDDLAKEGQKLSPLPAAFQSLRQRVDGLDKGLTALRAEVAAVPKQLDASLNALKDAMTSRPAPDQVSPADIGRNLGAALFREGKYAAARDVFLALIQNDPKDARIWYFAALANGLTSGDWTGDSERMVRRGLECEQGGKPKRSDIDAQFSTLTREKGKGWLEDWRKRASR